MTGQAPAGKITGAIWYHWEQPPGGPRDGVYIPLRCRWERVYVYTHTHIHTCHCVYINMHIDTCMCHVCTHTDTNILVCVMCVHTYYQFWLSPYSLWFHLKHLLIKRVQSELIPREKEKDPKGKKSQTNQNMILCFLLNPCIISLWNYSKNLGEIISIYPFNLNF